LNLQVLVFEETAPLGEPDRRAYQCRNDDANLNLMELIPLCVDHGASSDGSVDQSSAFRRPSVVQARAPDLSTGQISSRSHRTESASQQTDRRTCAGDWSPLSRGNERKRFR